MNGSVALVLGAAGFVGRNVARVLSEKGCRVLGVGHGIWTESEWREWGLVDWLNADIDIESIDQITADQSPQCIIHCGGSGTVSFSYAHPLEDFQRTVQSTVAVLEWIRLRNPETCHFILVSSAAVYGDQGDSNATENSLRSPISPYGMHKMSAELFCESYSRFFGVSSSIVRLFSVYGEGLRKQLLWDALNKFRDGQSNFFGTGNELRDWIHVEDAARLIALTAIGEQPSLEIYNGGGTHATTGEVLRRLADMYGCEGNLHFTGETHAGNPRRLTSKRSHAEMHLGWSQTINLEEGLRRYVTWFKSQNTPSSK